MTPYVIEDTPNGEKLYDVYARLIKDRIIFVGMGIEDQMANVIVAQLLLLDQQSDAPIKMYINSPGGVVSSGLAIYDTMQLIKAPVHTICVGQAASMGSVLLAGGAKGHRSILPSSRVMIHQPSGGFQGKSTDMELNLEEMKRIRQVLYELLAKDCGKTFDEIAEDCKADKWFSAEEAVAYGLVDKVVEKK